jgi:phage-related protein
MSDAQARILIQAEMNDRLSAALQRINIQLNNTVRSLNGLKATSQGAVGATNAVGAAISQLSRQSNGLGVSLRNNARSQQTLAVGFRSSAAQANALQMQLSRLRSNGFDVAPIRAYISQLRVMNSMQKQIGNSMRAMNFQKMSTQLNAFSQRMTNAGSRITMGLTLPLVAFFRIGFQSFKALDKQVIRTTKLMADSFDDVTKNTSGARKGYTDLGFAVKQLGVRLDDITATWGVSRELVQGLAGDFAELGISNPKALGDLTLLTVEFEKLGNIDITQAQKTIQALYQTIARVRRDKGLDVTSAEALTQMTEEINGAIAFFNFAENKTTLSLNNIAEAFPEVTAAATSFGLSMQLTSAMLVPMIGAAFQTGASANSIKVSLQRMISTTKQNKDMLESLSGVLGDKFVPSLDIASQGVLDLVNNYQALKDELGDKGTLEFMSKFFGVRQGPRMDVTIEQMSEYQKQLKDATSQEAKMLKGVEDNVNEQLRLIGGKEVELKSFHDIEVMNRRAQEMNKETLEFTGEAKAIQIGQERAYAKLTEQQAAREAQSEKIIRVKGKLIEGGAKAAEGTTKAQVKQNKAGEAFNKITTETGKLIQGFAYGTAATSKNKKDELDRVRNSVEVQYNIARENAKSIARELTSVFGGILEGLNPVLKKIAKFFRELSPATKKIMGVILIALAAIGPLMRTIGAIGQLGAMFAGARAAAIKGFRGNVVQLNQSLMQTSDIALRLGGNFKKFGQDGKVFTTRKDAKRLEKLAPIIAKNDAGEKLTNKEASKGAKYVRQLTGRKAVMDKTALLPKGVQNLKGLDMVTRDYVKSLDPIFQANQLVDNALLELKTKRTSIFRKAAQKVLKTRPALNNATGSGIDPATGSPTGAGFIGPRLPTGPAPVTSTLGGIEVLRNILSQILASIQAIQACVCNAKAAATGRPSPAASGAPINGPPAGGAGGTTSAAATTGTPAPTGAAVTAVTGPITAAAVTARQAYAELIRTSPLFQKYGLSLRDVIITAKSLNRGIQGSISGKGLNVDFATVKTISQDAVFTKVLLEKYGIDINKVVDQYRQAVVDARNNLVAGARPTTPAPTVSPVPAAIETATVAGNKVVAENIVAGTKAKGGRPKGSASKPKAPAPTPVAPPVIGTATSFAGDYGFGYAKAISGVNKSVQEMIQGASGTAKKVSVDFTSIGKTIAQVSGVQKIGKNSYAITKEAIISMYNTLGVKVPAELAQIANLINKETGQVVTTSAAGLAKLAAQIKAGTTGAAISAGSGQVTGKTSNPFYVQQLNTDFGKAMGTGTDRRSPALAAEMRADAPVAVADQKAHEGKLRARVEELKTRVLRVQRIGEDIDSKVAAILEQKRATKSVDIKSKLEAKIKRLQKHARVLNDYESQLNEAIGRGTFMLSQGQATSTGFQITQRRRAAGLAPGTALPDMQAARQIAYKTPAFSNVAPSYLDVAYGSKDVRGRDSASFKERMSLASTREIDPEVKAAKAAQIAAGKIQLQAVKEYAASLKSFTGLKPSEQGSTTRVTGGPVVTKQMTQDDLLRVNKKEIAEAQKLIPTLEQRVVALQKRIAEINGQTRVPGGKVSALRPLKADLKEVEGLLKGTKENLVKLTTLPKPVAPKPAGGGGRVGGTSMLNDPMMGAMAGMQPRGRRMPQIGPRLASMDTGAITGGVSTVYGEIQTALKIPADIMQQVIKDLAVKHSQITGVGKAATTNINGTATSLIEALKLSIVDPANATVDQVRNALIAARPKFARLETEALKAARTGAPAPAASTGRTAAPVASGREAFGYGLPRGTDEGKESGTQKGLAKQVADNIRATKKSTEDFLLYEKKTLEYIAKEFGIKGASKIKAGELVAKLQQTLVDLGHSVEKAIVTEGIAPVTAATNAVTATAATAAGASADETVALVNAEKNLGVAVENSIATAAGAVTKAAGAAKNSYLANIKASGPALPTGTSVMTPYSKPARGRGMDKSLDDFARTYGIRTVSNPMKSSGVNVSAETQSRLDVARNAVAVPTPSVVSVKPAIVKAVTDADRELIKTVETKLTETATVLTKAKAAVSKTTVPKLDVPMGNARTLIGNIDVPAQLAKQKADAAAATIAQKAAMDARIRANVFASANIRRVTGGAGRFDPPPPPPTRMQSLIDDARGRGRSAIGRVRSSIIGAAMAPSIATPKQLFSGGVRTPNSAEVTGTIAKIANPVRIGTMIGKAFLAPATAVAKAVSSPSAIQKVNDGIQGTINKFNLFFRKPVIRGASKNLDEMYGSRTPGMFQTRVGTSVPTIKAGLERDARARGIDPSTPRQQRIINKTSQRMGLRDNNITNSRFEIAANAMVNKVKAFGTRITSALQVANSVIDPTLGVATMVAGQIIKAPVTFTQVYTKAVIAGHKIAFSIISSGLTLLSTQTASAIASFAATNFAQTTIAGKSILYVAQTLQKGLVGLSAGIGNLPTTIGTAFNLTVNAIKNPKASLISAGQGILSAAGSIKTGALKLAQAAILAGQAGGQMAVNAAKNGVTGAGQSMQSFLYGGGPKGITTADDGTITKKAGLFGRKSVTDAAGNVTRGPGMFGRMKGGIGKGLTGAVGGLGNAASSVSSMMLYKLGPAGMALQGPMNKVIGLLTKTKGAFFGVALPIMLVVGAIFLLKKTFNAWKDSSTGVAENFSKAFKAIMAVVGMLKTAFFDFFASLFGGAESSSGATANIGKTMTTVAETVRKFAEGFKAFFEKYVMPSIYRVLSGLSLVIRGVIEFVLNVIKFVAALVSFFRGGGEKAKEAMNKAWHGMLEGLRKVLKGILKIAMPILILLVKAVFKIVELIVQMFEWMVIGIINAISGMVRGAINLFFTILKAYITIIDKIIELWVTLEKAIVNIALAIVRGVINLFFGIVKGTVAVVKGIINIWAKLPEGIGKGIGLIAGLISNLIRGIADKLGKIWGLGPTIKKGLYDVADGFESAGEGAENFGKSTTKTLEGGVDSIFKPIENGIQNVQNGVLNTLTGIGTFILGNLDKLKGVADVVKGVVQKIQNGLLSGVEGASEAAGRFIGGFSDGIASLSKDITDWLGGLAEGDDIKKGIGKQLEDAVDEIKTRNPSGAEAAGKSIADAIGKGMKSLKQNFYDKVVDNLSNSLGKLKDNITKALEKQKDQSLKFFDDQIKAIDALAAADAELTAEKQKQEDERLRIAERALQRDSYLKNRALAIYEGRIDDARTMGLEEAKNQQDFNRDTLKNAKDAEAAAKAKNVDAAKAVITQQKDAASIEFDRVLEDYQAFLESVGANGTLTQAQLTEQFNAIQARATLASTGMQTAFQGYYNALPGLITANTEPTVGFFTGSMDALIASAQGRFGLDANSTDPASLLGVTNGMLGNMGLAYTNGFAAVVAPAYNDGQALLTGIATEFADPSTTNPKSAAGIYASAISNATEAVKAEFMKMKTDASSAFAQVVAAINDEVRGLAISQAIADATEEIRNSTSGGGTTTTPATGTPATGTPATSVTGPAAPTGFGPMGFTQTAFEALAGPDRLFKLNDSNDYIKTAKAALAFYGYSGFDVNSTKMGAGTKAALKNFQTKYPVVGNNDGNLGPASAKALGLFSGVGVQKKFMGGIIRRAMGGSVPGYSTEGVPAILHGGEYVISSKAVQNLGLGLLTQLNGLKHGVPSFNVPKPMMSNASGMNTNITSHSQSETTQNYNFYVDNFIGEDQWFESMMKDYNIKVVPNNQKAAGLESRVVRTYNGINRGM